MAMPKKPRVKLKCPNCKKMFEVIESQAHRRIFCSRTCQLDGKFNPNFGNHPTAWNKGVPHSEETKIKISRSKQGRRIPNLTGKNNGMYKRGYFKNVSGYIEVSRNGKHIKQHRLIWEKINGPIPKGHHIHHINGNKTDNRIENLKLMSASEHISMHKKGNKNWEVHKLKLKKEKDTFSNT